MKDHREKRLKILDVPFDVVSAGDALSKVEQFLNGDRPYFVTTPNPEICLHAYKDAAYRLILNTADLSIPDGFGILWANRFLSGSRNIFRLLWTLMTPWATPEATVFPGRLSGVDFMISICKRFHDRRFFLLGAQESVNRKVRTLLQQKFGTDVVGGDSGSNCEEDENRIIELINKSGAEIVFVAFGAPKQERWIYRNLRRLSKIRVIVGVGGAFDFIADHKKRAPHFMRRLGLEWLFRLWKEPSRIVRIMRATGVFPLTLFFERRQK